MGGNTGRVALGVATGGLSEIPRMFDDGSGGGSGGKKKKLSQSIAPQQKGLAIPFQRTNETLLTNRGGGNNLGAGTSLLR